MSTSKLYTYIRRGFCLLCIINFAFFSGCGKRQYMIIYDLNYENKTKTEIIDAGAVFEPENPFRAGYTFDGWWWYDEDGEAYQWNNETDSRYDNLTLTAHWKLLGKTIKLDPNGGECEVDSIEIYYNTPYSFPIPIRDGYTFAGWRIGGTDLTKMGQRIWSFELDPTYCKAKWVTYPLGMTVTIGRFEQDGNLENGPEEIVWYVLDYRDGQYLLLSKHILSGMRYSEQKYKPIWETSIVREWLNGEFFTTAFTDEERQYIKKTFLEKEKVTDQVFFLQKKDIEEINDKLISLGLPTEYALTQGVKALNTQMDYITEVVYNSTWYFLRNGGAMDGTTWSSGSTTWGPSQNGVRPAMWIDASFVKTP